MQAMVLKEIAPLSGRSAPLAWMSMPDPAPGPGEILVRVAACGVCHTELDEIEGRTPPPRLPVIPGHQVVGRVWASGPGARRFRPGDRVGVGWIFRACGTCAFCREGRENLCSAFAATGRDAHGGYAPFLAVPEAFALPMPEGLSDAEAAPLLCAGAIGYRSFRLTGLQDGQRLGLAGFGASAHLVLQIVRHACPRTEVFVFARSEEQQAFGRELGAVWAGDISAPSPEKLHAVIDTTPAWGPIVASLHNLLPGGRLVVNAIRKERQDQAALLSLDYANHLWMEKEIRSVANVTRQDIAECLALAAAIPLLPEIQVYPLSGANEALCALKAGKSRGAKVLVMD